MNLKNKKLIGATLLGMGLLYSPTIAHADEGVVTTDFNVTDEEGNIVKSYKSNELLHISGETPNTYKLTINDGLYYVSKQSILKTAKHIEESLTIVKEETTLKQSPDYFGNVILQLDKENIVTRLSEEKDGFIKIRTLQNIEGWVLASAIEQNFRKEAVLTPAYVKSDKLQNKGLTYGDSIVITGFKNNQYQIQFKSLELNKETVSFVKPPKRVIYFNSKTNKMQNGESDFSFISPVRSTNISSLPGHRTDPVYGDTRYHAGTDIAIPKNTPIYATASGVVSKSHTGETDNNGAGLGNYVKIQHKDNIVSTYGHLTSLTVSSGQTVKQGQLIGYSGTTGKSTGYHLHFEIFKNGVVMDSSLVIKSPQNRLAVAP